MRLRSELTGVLTLAVIASGLAVGLSGGSPAGAASANTTILCEAGTAGPGGAVEFDLEARDGYIELPDGNTIYTWSYSLAADPFQFPAPTLCVDEGDLVRVTLTNPDHDLAGGLPANLEGGIPAEFTSLSFPGQIGVTTSGGVLGLLTREVDSGIPGDAVIYEFVAGAPGTYLYQSGTDQAVQIQMGMFGGFIVYPSAGRNFAYDGVEFDVDNEYLLIFHEMDPVLHSSVELASLAGVVGDAVLDDYAPLDRHNRYWTINGRSFPDVIAPNNTPVLPSQPYGGLVQINADDPDDAYDQLPALVRYGNAGLDNHPFHPHGNHLRLIAQDARPLADEIESYTKTVAAGQTFDLLAEWKDVEAWQGSGSPVAVDVPALENIVFKDGVTWYSGSADLGQTGQLPLDTTTYTVCGEYYFPWHSHALNEVQNFDEGFGGMLTLWRVDPPKEFDTGANAWLTPEACR